MDRTINCGPFSAERALAYGFTGPNLDLKPEFAASYEYGADMTWFDNRLGLDITTYRKETSDQIVNDIRGSYATGFILFNLNGAKTRNTGLEATVKFTPVLKNNFSWDMLANFDRSRGVTLALPNALPESYVSDTWLFGNVRNGTAPNLSTRSLTGLFYLRNKDNKLLIEGHCDERGTEEYNRALGERRALAAREYLNSLGIKGERVRTVSYGEDRPSVDGHDESAWSKNRRAEFILLKPPGVR